MLLGVMIGRGQLISSFHMSTPIIYKASRTTNLFVSTEIPPIDEEVGDTNVHMAAIGLAGVGNEELPFLLNAVSKACSDFGITFTKEHLKHETTPAKLENVHGANGRVILLSLNNVDATWTWNDERLVPFQCLISEKLDEIMYGMDDNTCSPSIEQPILICIRPSYGFLPNTSNLPLILGQVAKKEVDQYELCKPLLDQKIAYDPKDSIVPNIHVEIDGAMVMNPYLGKETWDTSSIFVFDELVDNDLRERLLDVVLGEGISDPNQVRWNDVSDGPDPNRWMLGGLDDVPGSESAVSEAPSCWGLREEAIDDLCFCSHDAITEFEMKLMRLFPDYIVTRLPEAVLGACVSPLTANAPTSNDSFSYHIDADPNAAPPCK